jgi:hypothetical protein
MALALATHLGKTTDIVKAEVRRNLSVNLEILKNCKLNTALMAVFLYNGIGGDDHEETYS